LITISKSEIEHDLLILSTSPPVGHVNPTSPLQVLITKYLKFQIKSKNIICSQNNNAEIN